MKRTTIVLMMLMLLGVFACPAGLQAQVSESESALDDCSFAERITMVTIDVQMEGGTIYEFIEMLRETSPIHLNIVVVGGASDIEIVPLDLEEIAIEGALSAMVIASGDRVVVDVSDSEEFISIQLDDVTFETHTAVASVKNLDEALLQDAISVGLSTLRVDPQVTFKIHAGTGLLFINGPSAEVRLVVQIADMLQEQVMSFGSAGGGGFGGGDDGGSH